MIQPQRDFPVLFIPENWRQDASILIPTPREHRETKTKRSGKIVIVPLDLNDLSILGRNSPYNHRQF